MKPQSLSILLIGNTGQVGFELARTMAPLGNVIELGRPAIDLAKPETLRPLVREIKPAIIVNAAAYTAVDAAETQEELARLVNGCAPGVLAEEAQRCDAFLIHFSTDYVFDGRKTLPYQEEDRPNPLGAYGRSKLEGERAIQLAMEKFLILRISWIFASRGRNFLRTILRLAQDREEIRVVNDQFGSPTWARSVAQTTALMAARWTWQASGFPYGIYHLSSAGQTSWHGFATRIIEIARTHPILSDPLKVQRVVPIPSSEYPTPAVRPSFSVLDSTRLRNRFGLGIPQWEHGVSSAIQEFSP